MRIGLLAAAGARPRHAAMVRHTTTRQPRNIRISEL
jgi:hypothetical protein